MTLVRTITACRACGDPKLDGVLDLGNLAISDFLEPGQEVERAPLELVRCAGCGLVQLRHTVERDRLYRTYHYRSSVNETMVAALADVADDARSRVQLERGDAVLDIGCNDGTLLRFYPDWVTKIGFDPSDVAQDAWLAQRKPHYTLHRDYFPTTRQHAPVPCKIVTAVAMFYDLDDPGRFLDEVKRWLHPEGVLVLQFQDLWSMTQANAVDNVCHEHLTYWSLDPLRLLLDRHGLKITDFGIQPVNGGSLRVVVHHRDAPALPMYKLPEWGWDRLLEDFADRVQANKQDTRALLERLKAAGQTVYGLAASTKWNTLSQFYGIGPDLITAIGERSPHKVGKRTVTGIPIVSEEAVRAARPDYLVACAWQFADAFAEREKDLLAGGTRLIVPLPTLRVVEKGLASGIRTRVPGPTASAEGPLRRPRSPGPHAAVGAPYRTA